MATGEDRVDSSRRRQDGSSSYHAYSIRRVQETHHETLSVRGSGSLEL